VLARRTSSEEETLALGVKIGRGLPHGAVVLLVGDLGAGKTTLAKGIVQGLGAAAPEEVTSPTYTLIHEYTGERKVYHIDLYRLETASEAAALGIDELMDGNAVLLIEWGERFPELWPDDTIEIRLTARGDEVREISAPSLWPV
jgi:tRNA threonylcarbamoyladenosine biosynthesis protein TsaE